MRSKKLASGRVDQRTQKYLDVYEIRDDIVVLRDGSLRAVLLVSGINFSLKYEDEQNAIIQAYVQFLNSLDFPLQIVIQSRKLNIDDYLTRIKNIEREQENELLRIQTSEYRQYIRELVDLADIMTKRFYVVVPYLPYGNSKKNFWTRFTEVFSPAAAVVLQKKKFQKFKEQLDRRVNLISEGLGSMGLTSIVLDTQGLIELYYNTYNPVISQQELMKDVNKLRVEE